MEVVEGMVPISSSEFLNPFYLGACPVTQAQWEAVMGENPSCFKGAGNPVEQVSWNDCQKFLKKLNLHPVVQESGFIFRLPTEREWECACRAGASGVYCKLADGTEITESTIERVAWFGNNSNGKTHPVGLKEPNAFGLYDMYGNVWEWTETTNGRLCVLRGGGWNDSPKDYEFSLRDLFSSSFRSSYLGFRLCASGRVD